MPHKFKIAVSGCPRNCAEATIKDFGVICVDSGYELHIGGNGGIHLRGTDLLCKVATPEELRVPVPSVVDPSRNVTVPVGVPVPDAGATVAVKVTFSPVMLGLTLEVSAVVVAGLTRCDRGPEVLPVKFELPA